MKAKDIKTKNDSDLVKLITDERESLRTFRFSEAGSRTKNVKAAREMKKTVARAMTELASRRKNA
ncbi:MAG TPA: 50S ribosomal protein L29 [Candidatus Paceibacterota bacterium]|nr:50S ribosomal protein L29 [Candidatus Paceibacterota bacterium]